MDIEKNEEEKVKKKTQKRKIQDSILFSLFDYIVLIHSA